MNESDRQSEAIERAALLSLHEHCPKATREALGLFLEPVGDAIVAGSSRDGSILLNRTLGLATHNAATADTVAEIRRIYSANGVSRYFLHAYSGDDPRLADLLSSQSLVPARGWMKFARDNSAPLERPTSFEIRRVSGDEANDFGRIVALAFGMSTAAAPLLAGLAADPRWHLFVSYEGKTAAGAGALFVDGEAAFLEWGATDPAFRRRGSQGAIMTARVRAAIDHGCTALYTETGEAVEGEAQHSYGNIERYGFVATTLRQNWAPPTRQ